MFAHYVDIRGHPIIQGRDVEHLYEDVFYGRRSLEKLRGPADEGVRQKAKWLFHGFDELIDLIEARTGFFYGRNYVTKNQITSFPDLLLKALKIEKQFDNVEDNELATSFV